MSLYFIIVLSVPATRRVRTWRYRHKLAYAGLVRTIGLGAATAAPVPVDTNPGYPY